MPDVYAGMNSPSISLAGTCELSTNDIVVRSVESCVPDLFLECKQHAPEHSADLTKEVRSHSMADDPSRDVQSREELEDIRHSGEDQPLQPSLVMAEYDHGMNKAASCRELLPMEACTDIL